MKHGFLWAIIIMCAVLHAQEPPAIITHITGDVGLLRADDSILQPAEMLDDLFEGDSLIVQGGEATVLFETGTIVLIQDSGAIFITSVVDSVRGIGTDHVLSEDVRFSVSPLFEVGKGFEKIVPKFVVRAPDDTLAVPLTIYVPGNTSLSNSRPDVIWSPHPEANWYAVVFQMRGQVLINNATTDTVMPFFEQNEDLAPGSYMINIHAFHDNDTLTSEQCFVRVLDSVEVETVRQKIAALDEVGVDEYTKHMLKAFVYEDHALLVRAVQYYEAMSALHPDAVFPYKALANLYGKLGLPEQANTYIDRYEALQTIGK
ncbi:hypothetical protein JXB22_10565 [candidate division WOR-3 bacterium]|nr:hypothetical protein [candidate division WOR-3 bacterium]